MSNIYDTTFRESVFCIVSQETRMKQRFVLENLCSSSVIQRFNIMLLHLTEEVIRAVLD